MHGVGWCVVVRKGGERKEMRGGMERGAGGVAHQQEGAVGGVGHVREGRGRETGAEGREVEMVAGQSGGIGICEEGGGE